MKQICLIFITFITIIRPIYAVDSTPSAKAQDLLDRVATKVAQLGTKFQKAYRGKIKTIGTTSIVISTQETDKSINTNDATAFYRFRSNTRTEINFTSLKVGDDITAVGTIDPATSDITARQIVAKIKRTNFVGKITSIDKSILTIDDSQKIDFSDAVSLKMIATESGKIVSAKESDFKIGSTIFAIIYSPDEKTGVFSVLKALTIQK